MLISIRIETAAVVAFLLLVLVPPTVKAQLCTCHEGSSFLLDVVSDESSIGSASTVPNHDDTNSWFSSLYYNQSHANPDISYRYCELPRTIEATTGCSVLQVFGPAPVCGEWKTRLIRDGVNTRVFPGAPQLGVTADCPHEPAAATGQSKYCPEMTDQRAVLAYSDSGTVCFSYRLSEYNRNFCSFADGDVETECFSLQDPSYIHTLALEKTVDSFLPSYQSIATLYVEVSFGSRPPQQDDDMPEKHCKVVEVIKACAGTDGNHVPGIYRQVDNKYPCRHPDAVGKLVYLQENLDGNRNQMLWYDGRRRSWRLMLEDLYCQGTDYEIAHFWPGRDAATCWDGIEEDQSEQVDKPLEIACRPEDYPERSEASCAAFPVDASLYWTDCLDDETVRLNWAQCENNEVTGTDTWVIDCPSIGGQYCHKCVHISNGYVCSDEPDNDIACQLLEDDAECSTTEAFGLNSPCKGNEFVVTEHKCKNGRFQKEEVFSQACSEQYHEGLPICQDQCKGYDICAEAPVDCSKDLVQEDQVEKDQVQEDQVQELDSYRQQSSDVVSMGIAARGLVFVVLVTCYLTLHI